jgi:hypothetical protein
MIFNMHCRPSCPTNDSTCSFSFLFVHPDYTNTINHHICPSSSYHDQISPPAPRRRRRLEDPIITYASNYYATYPRQTSHSPSPQSPPLRAPRQIYQQFDKKNIYCDLFNLLERPPPVKQRRKHTLNDYNPCRRYRSIDYKNAHGKLNDINDQKRPQPSSYYKDKQPQDNKLSPIQRLQEKSKTNNCIYQRHSINKGFFRRVARNYFCMPMTTNNGEFSN